jgi:hypothetical protein
MGSVVDDVSARAGQARVARFTRDVARGGGSGRTDGTIGERPGGRSDAIQIDKTPFLFYFEDIMQLTLNQSLFLVLTFAAVVAVVFLVRFLVQLRSTAEEGERTLAEVRKLVENLNNLDGMIKDRLVSLGEFVEASKKTAVNVSEASFLLTTRILRPGSKYWSILLPVASYFWKKFRKRKEK